MYRLTVSFLMNQIVTRYVRNVFQEHYKPVNPYLAITPRQMEEMTMQGRAVSTQSLANYEYFNGDQLDGLPVDLVRGVDINSVWEASQDTKQKMAKLRTRKARELHRMQVKQQEGV